MNQNPLLESESVFENTAIDAGHLPAVEHIAFTPIEPRYARVLYLSNSIFYIVLLIVLIILLVSNLGLFHWITLSALLLWIVLYLSSLWFAAESVKKKAYAIRQRDISYRTGIFFQQWITIPFNRVQHCEVSRSVFDNLFRLSELKIFTAGGSSSDISIPGLEPDIADALKEMIINKIKAQDEEE